MGVIMNWTKNKAWEWYENVGWLCGFNYVPSTAINTTEMWQCETFDLQTIDRELGWAEQLGFNSCRIFIQYLVWTVDKKGLLKRIDKFLDVANHHKITTVMCLMDDCAFSGKQPYLGPQDNPKPGIHNSCWTPSPGHERVINRSFWPDLEAYINEIVSHFSADHRILMWDLYNEAGNAKMGNKSLPLLKECFIWARTAKPIQPLTACIYDKDLHDINEVVLKLSDIITFHNYNPLPHLKMVVEKLRAFSRPLICTEWMARSRGSRINTHLPFFCQEGIGCYIWGLVNGKTQTSFGWETLESASKRAEEPGEWFHDLLHPNGEPYSDEEIQILREQTNSSISLNEKRLL